MKRLHVHVAVADLRQSVRFYATLFGAEPSVLEPDYAKWMLDDPRVNFAISARGAEAGLSHLGLQVDDEDELAEVRGRLQAAERPLLEQRDAACCYAKSDKVWVTDPTGLAWETFLSRGAHGDYGDDIRRPAEPAVSAAKHPAAMADCGCPTAPLHPMAAEPCCASRATATG